MKLSKNQAALLWQLQHGWQLNYQRLTAACRRHYFITRNGERQEVNLRTGRALVDAGYVEVSGRSGKFGAIQYRISNRADPANSVTG